MLLESGADINRKTRKGITAIYCCAANGHLTILKLLIQKGALLNVEYSFGRFFLKYSQLIIQILNLKILFL